jgi:hypothetical protein
MVEYKLDETKSKNRLWERNDWHRCKPNNTIVNPKSIFWFCWECGKKIDIENHPCLHYQQLDKSKRSQVRMGATK